jgi:hypothetical protein
LYGVAAPTRAAPMEDGAMVTLMEGLPDKIVGLEGTGRITGEDYERVVVPAVEDRLRRHKKIRLLYHLGEDFEGVSARATWEDTKVGLRHLLQFERMAIVSDDEWIRGAVRVFGFVMPCEVRVFDDTHLDEARAWISE